MTLEEFIKAVTDSCQQAHLFISDGYTPKRVKSVSLRMDDDGVLSVLLHPQRMEKRVETDETKRLAKHRKMMASLIEREPALKEQFNDFDGFFVHWDEITCALSNAGDDYQAWDESPLELIAKLIDERNELISEVDELIEARKETAETPPAEAG